jgi:hypothetical protein
MRAGDEALRAEMRESNEALRAEMRAEMREGHDALRADMRAGDETTRRHFDVVAERLYSLIRTVAEGVAANTEAIERLGHDLRGEMDARFKSFEMILRATFAGLRRDIDDLRTQS